MLFLYLSLSFFLINVTFAGVDKEAKILERPSLVQEMSSLLGAHKIVNLHGLSGVGKTVTAGLLTKKLKQEGKQVLWFQWDETTLKEQIQNHHKIIGPFHSEALETSTKVCQDVVLILDNYNEQDLKPLLRYFEKIMASGSVKILITSQNKLPCAFNMAMPLMTAEEVMDLMVLYFPEMSQTHLKRISTKVGFYPYLISTLCSLANSSPIYSLQRIEGIIDSDPDALFLKNWEEKSTKDPQRKGNLAIQDLIMDVKQNHPLSYKILCFMAHLSKKSIPLDLIYAFVGNEEDADYCIEYLIKRSLIDSVDKENDCIVCSLHEITQKTALQTTF